MNLVRYWMERKGLTLDELCQRTNVNRRTLEKVVQGVAKSTGFPSVDEAIARALGVEIWQAFPLAPHCLPNPLVAEYLRQKRKTEAKQATQKPETDSAFDEWWREHRARVEENRRALEEGPYPPAYSQTQPGVWEGVGHWTTWERRQHQRQR
ncbi:XRE family transcriptional regulator [Ammonifex thiophilus]|uniref:XRE family transcriptional regulator n=1 Tax=Ammonifex thiophilus TaxID=444093 RepID=A0A3D8P6D4_9THEO|nr:XRE family transcriptional regulator [Ammonifex thiophilus]